MKNLLLVAGLARAFTFTGEVTAADNAPDRIGDFREEVVISLRSLGNASPPMSAFVMEDGRFHFVDIPEDEYTLSVVNSRFLYPPVVIDSKTRIAAILQSYEEDDFVTFSLDNLVIRPLGNMEFFPPKQPFDVFQSLKSPMFIFTAGVIGLMAVLTKLQSSLGDDQDPNVAGRIADMQVLIEKTMLPFEKQSLE